MLILCFLFNDTSNTVIYTDYHTLSLYCSLPICEGLLPSHVQPLISDSTEAAFIAMSKVAMEELRGKASQESFATGGHVCFFVYRIRTSSFLLVAMVKERGGMVLSAALEPTEITEIDLSKLHQAARVNPDRYGAFLAPANGKAI